MKTIRITMAELEEHFEIYVDRASEGENFIFEHNGKDFLLTKFSQRGFPNRLMGTSQ